MSIEVMRQARNAFVWNLNTDLDNIPACEKWAKMLRENIDNLDKALEQSTEQEPVCAHGIEKNKCEFCYPPPLKPLTYEQLKPRIQEAMRYYGHNPDHWHLTAGAGYCLLARAIEAAHGIGEKE